MRNSVHDYVVIGAGSAGGALATRLAEAGRTVLLLEAGEDDRWPWLRVPAGLWKVILSDSGRVLWRFFTEPESRLAGRRVYWPRGRLPGGSSGVNAMLWSWGDPREYDDWRDRLGLEGWGYDAIKPLLQRVERLVGSGNPERGRNGRVQIERFALREPLMEAFFEACVSEGIPRIDDYNGRYDGVAYLQMNVRRGRRHGVREAYLDALGAAARGFLDLRCGARVERILFDGSRATGARYRRGGETLEAAARREVILCAGTIQSPQLLEVSGVGAAHRLQVLGVPLIADRPGVGENLIDHLHWTAAYRCRGAKTFNQVAKDRRAQLGWGLRWLLAGDGLLTSVGPVAHALVRSNPLCDRPDIKLQLTWLSSPDLRSERGLALDPFPGISIGSFVLQPRSRGAVHAISPAVDTAPSIVANYLADERDRALVLESLRLKRRISAALPFKPFALEEVRPGRTVQDESAVLDYVAQVGQTSYHPVGTCRMGMDADAVVDAQLRVRGVQHLRVADASVFPTIPSSNTNAPSIAVGERVADLLAQAEKE